MSWSKKQHDLFDAIHEDYELSEKRLAICEQCEFIVRNLSIRRCGKCQCILKVKTLFPSQQCPIKRW